MIPIHLAVPALAVAVAIGWAIDLALGRPFASQGSLAWILRAFAGAVAVLALALHPLALAGLAALLALARGPAAVVRTEGARAALACIAVFAVIAWARPAVPIPWDEHVWLAKTRLAADPLALRSAALDPASEVIPRGYPILATLAQAALALFRTDLAALVAGATALAVLVFAVAIAALPADRRVAFSCALLAAPLAWIHARSAYLDLVVGLLALAVLAALVRAREGERGALVVAVLGSFLLAGAKDEGAAHAVAVAAACALGGDRRGPALVVAAALASALTWRVLLASSGVANGDHALEGAGLRHAGAILGELVRGATEVRSWGATWPIAIAAAIVGARGSARARTLAVALSLSLAALVAGLLLGSDRLRAFALDGTLVGRMWMQLLPIAAWTALEALAPIAGARTAAPAASRA